MTAKRFLVEVHQARRSRRRLRPLRQLPLAVLTGILSASGPWCQAWLCQDVVGQVRALPSKELYNIYFLGLVGPRVIFIDRYTISVIETRKG
jgi:hypothetical protein